MMLNQFPKQFLDLRPRLRKRNPTLLGDFVHTPLASPGLLVARGQTSLAWAGWIVTQYAPMAKVGIMSSKAHRNIQTPCMNYLLK